MADWIPGKEPDRIELMKRWNEGLENPVYKTQFGWAGADCAAVTGKIEAALSSYNSYTADNSTARRIAKDRAMQEALRAIREFANSSIRYNKKMAAEYRIVFGIREADREPTWRGEPPTRAVVTGLKPLGGAAVEIRFQDEETPHSRAIPAGYNGCLLAYACGKEKVGDYSLLTRTDLMTRHIWRLELPPETAGLWLALAEPYRKEGEVERYSAYSGKLRGINRGLRGGNREN
jgi:hypothetical protein